LFRYPHIYRALRVGKDGRAEMLHTGTDIVAGCNLRCEFCSSFSPYHKGFIPADELFASFTEWRKKIKPKTFVLSGGEPFLHPELARIVRESAGIWNDSKLLIISNGLLLENTKPEVLQAIKETGCELTISEHTFEPEHRKKLDAGYARLKQAGIPFVAYPCHSAWMKVYQCDSEGVCTPFKSNPKKAWDVCVFRGCTCIVGDKLYQCTRFHLIYDAVQKGILDAETWKAALTYQPLTLQSTAEDIVEHLRRKNMPECTVCAEKYDIVPARQMPVSQPVDKFGFPVTPAKAGV
jgi:hypothetical protein